MTKAKGRVAFWPLGQKARKDNEKERKRIEGSFGHAKEHFGLDQVRFADKDGSEMRVRAGIEPDDSYEESVTVKRCGLK
jgi:hypothetical protein